MDGATTRSGSQADDPYVARARYYSPANIFQVERRPVPRRNFVDECAWARAPGTPTGWLTLDISGEIGIDGPATTPLMLARYATVRPGETLEGNFAASGEFYYVMSGSGTAAKDVDRLSFETGDVFSLPGGGTTRLDAGPEGAVLCQFTNEPEIAFHSVRPPSPGDAPVRAARYPMADILDELARARDANRDDPGRSGMALHLTTERGGSSDAAHPTIKVAINSLDAGRNQRPHRHNSVALTLPIRADRVHSVIEGERLDWHTHALMITPPAELHEHRNEGDEMMLSLVIQDGGLYFRCRTIGFSFD
ncbi:MAG: hypothetical protein JJ899_01755 [Alphaproteobacteria bacterium]|nr:hypothetical protein [Alphaproteobacteria bacterium]